MEPQQVFIVGDTLFAETLSRMLENSGQVAVVGRAPTFEAAVAEFTTRPPDVLVITEAGPAREELLPAVLENFSEIPIILADLRVDSIWLFTCRRIDTRVSDLLSVITSLPERR